MFITNNYSIREVLAFPFMKDHQNVHKPKTAAELAEVEPLPTEGIRKSSGPKQQYNIDPLGRLTIRSP